MFNEILLCREPNTEIRLFDKDGNPKPLWNENRLGKALSESIVFADRIGKSISRIFTEARITLADFFVSVKNLLNNLQRTIIVVPAESRTFAIAAESRIFSLPAETRIVSVPRVFTN